MTLYTTFQNLRELKNYVVDAYEITEHNLAWIIALRKGRVVDEHIESCATFPLFS